MRMKVLKPGQQYNTRKLIAIHKLGGELAAEMENIPKVLVGSIVKEIRNNSHLARSYIKECYKKAAEIFLNDDVDGMSFDEYLSTVHLVSGIPFPSLKKSVLELVDHLFTICDYINEQVPRGATMMEPENLKDCKVAWIRKGEVLSVIAAGNNPLTNNGWLEAFASGYKVIIKPSMNEPFTSYRLVKSLLKAGIPNDYLLYIPCGHDVVNELIESTDFSIVYGSEEMVKKYKNNKKVIMRGPGRAKLYWDEDYICKEIAFTKDIIIDSIISDGGMKCMNTSGILYHKSQRVYMQEIYEELLSKHTNKFFDEKGQLPLFETKKAVAIEEYLKSFIEKNNIDVISNNDHFFTEIEDGICSMNPLIMKVNEMTNEILNFEMGFPAVWTYEQKSEDELQYLKNSLVLRLLTDNEKVKEKFAFDYSVKKIIVNFENNNNFKNVPHEGYLLSKLFEAKGIC